MPGERGPKGCRGLPGEPGAQGIQGERGEQGIQGERGEQGLQGERGEQGLQGEQGVMGNPGQPGEQGEPGLQGERGEQGEQGERGEQGIQGERGEQGIQGERGERGPQGPPGSCEDCQGENQQAFVNSNIKGALSVPDKGAVKFPALSETPGEYYASGIDYDGTDTFTIKYAGLYSLTCVLSLEADNPPDNTFYIELNKTSPVAGTANLWTSGQITLTRVGYFDAGTTIRIVNGSGHAVKLCNSAANGSSTGHFALFRFADDGVEKRKTKKGVVPAH
jgi:hypothetical protein